MPGLMSEIALPILQALSIVPLEMPMAEQVNTDLESSNFRDNHIMCLSIYIESFIKKTFFFHVDFFAVGQVCAVHNWHTANKRRYVTASPCCVLIIRNAK